MLIEQLYLSRSPNVTLEVFFGVESQESGSLQVGARCGAGGLHSLSGNCFVLFFLRCSAAAQGWS